MRVVTQRDAKLLIIPAGFLTAKSEGAVVYQVAEVAKLAEKARLAIIGGVDVYATELSKRASESGERIAELVSRGRLPYFGFAVGRVTLRKDCRHPWRQTSTTSKNAKRVADADLPGADRLVRVAGRQVGVLICGELFNGRARRQMAQLRADLVVDLGHQGMSQGLIPAMRNLATEGECSVAHSQHLTWGKIHLVDARGRQASQAADANPLVKCEGLWAGWALRSI